jgi:hypothetical protein
VVETLRLTQAISWYRYGISNLETPTSGNSNPEV